MEIVVNLKKTNKLNFIMELLNSFSFIEIKKEKKTKEKKQIFLNNSIIEPDDSDIDPNFLFGKWKSLDIDAKKLRKESWKRS